MRPIEQYLSAYVIHCLFGSDEDVKLEYLYQVLRETSAKSAHPVLGKVLDYVRQGDPSDITIQAEVAAYVREMSNVNKRPTNPASPTAHIRYSIREGYVIFTVMDANRKMLALTVAEEKDKDMAIKEMLTYFPGAEIKQV